ncbi:type VI secretion system tip protein VgrG [Aureispira anguillae]|uniref:Type VI secretion system tip protein VgrG n=1 Tax=Aureispira anguillae TaxID=2864201 RepID=A0A915YJB1_9BACT|nr:type VI secretion system tip protein VgrG [Aureispira anguillae]BDS13996.1 type VI secretion system tip protein VgrG [Aureispira anguillae]
MADSPIKKLKSGIVNLEVTVDGTKIPEVMMVLETEVVKEVNKIPYAKVVIFDGDSRKQTFPQSDQAIFEPGGEIEIKIAHDPTATMVTIYKGLIIEHGIKLFKNGTSCLTLTCRDEALALTVGRKNMIFYEQTDSDIISAIIADSGIKGSADVEATTATHKKLIQYYSTDWDFIQARADANSLVTIINDGEISIKKPTVSEKTDVIVTYGVDLMAMDLKMDAAYQYEDVQANFWDHTAQAIENTAGVKPTVNAQGDVDSAKLSGVLKHKELVHSSTPITKDFIQSWADSIYQRGHLSRIRGKVTFVGSEKIVVGKTVELAAIGTRFNGDGYISKVRHIVKDGQWTTEASLGLPQRTHLERYPLATPLGAGGSLPAIGGLQHGVVIQIHEDPDGEYRVLVNIPIIDNLEGEGVWARMSHVYATEDCGFVFYPEVGDEVLLGFLDNDPTYPVILGSLYSSKRKITTEEAHDPADPNYMKAISFNKGKLRLEFVDEPGKNIFKLITEDEMMIEVNDDADTITIDDPVNKNNILLDSAGVTMTVDKDLTIDVKGDIKMTAGKGIAMEATNDITGKGMNVKFEAQVNFEAKGTAAFKAEGAQFEVKGSGMGTVDGGGMLTVKGGMVMIN